MIDWEKTLDEHFKMICAAANEVSQSYLMLPTTYRTDGIVRERVFCYEFYHQLRKLQPKNPLLIINGEIDKSGHQDFDIEDRKNPDFVFHVPGRMDMNTIVMEVKGKLSNSTVDKNSILKDYNTLASWVWQSKYEFGIFLLYNHTLEEFADVMNDTLLNYDSHVDNWRLYIITLPKAGNIEPIIRFDAFLDKYFPEQ